MYKFIFAVAVMGLTACGSSAKTEEAPAAGGAPAETTTVVADTTVASPAVDGPAAK